MRPAIVLLAFLWFSAADEADVLLEKLRTEDSAERRRLQTELLRLGADAVPALVRALENASPHPEEEVDRQVKRLASASWKERNEATQALVRLGRAAATLMESKIAGADAEAAWRLKAALAEIREKAGRDEQLEEARTGAICDVLGQSGDPRGTSSLLKILGAAPADQKLDLKRRAATALGLLRPALTPAQAEEATDKVLQVLERTPGPLEKGLLIKALGRLGTAGAARPIGALLADRSEKNSHLKRSCIAALVAIGQGRGIRAIVDALSFDEVYVRQGAVAALEELAGGDFGFDPRATAEANREAIAKFKAWGAEKYGKTWED